MGTFLNQKQFMAGLAFAGFMLAAAGCQSSVVPGSNLDAPKPPQEKILKANCGPIARA